MSRAEKQQKRTIEAPAPTSGGSLWCLRWVPVTSQFLRCGKDALLQVVERTVAFFLAPGPHPPEAIIGSIEAGLYVTELIGFGVNGVTGDYSRGAAGLWIERGELAYPVEEITIAGTLPATFRGIEMVGNDLVFRNAIAAPTLKIERMTVAGA